MIIGKREQRNPEQEQRVQISMLCRQKLLGYAESFEELGRSFHDELRIAGDDRQSILEKRLLQQSRQVMGDHLQTVARVMEQVAGEDMCYRPVEDKRRKSLIQALRSEGIIAEELCYIQKDGVSANGISMILSTVRSGCKASQVADMLTVLLGRQLQPSPGSSYLIEREPHCFQFTEEPKYVVLTGVSRAVKEGEKISGDQYAMLESEKGRLSLLLSDGTGAGEDASRGSARVLDLMEKMLEVGFDIEEAVNMLNTALYAQNNEEDHPTVDICSLDLYSGECKLCKVGGAASFLKECGGTECIGGESLPLGIFQKAQTEVRVRQLAAGDMLIMMTDGVLEALEDDCEERMRDMIESMEEQNPQEIAEKILSYAIRCCEGHIRDDMTVFAISLWNNM